MKLPLFTDDDKHSYLWYLLWSLCLIAIAITIFFLDSNLSRVFAVSGSILELAGAYWIAAGVVLRKSDIADLVHALGSGGSRHNDIISKKLIVQSRRAQFGVFYILVGTALQIVGAYVA